MTTQEAARALGISKSYLLDRVAFGVVPEPARNPKNNYRDWSSQDIVYARTILRRTGRGPGSRVPDPQWREFYNAVFVDGNSIASGCRRSGLAKQTGRRIFHDVREYRRLGKTHPRLEASR